MSADHTWLAPDRVHLIAHRGASHYAAENSPEAIAAAEKHGATDVEIDVNMTRDGILLATHDMTVGAAGERRWISQLPAEDVIAGAAEQGRPIRTLDSILAVVADSPMGVYLDVKQLLPGGVSAVTEVVDTFEMRDRVVTASFRVDLVAELKRRGEFVTSVLFHDPGLDIRSVAAGTGCDLVHPCYDVFPDPLGVLDADWMRAVHAIGLGVVTWNTLSVDVAESVMRLGARGVCSDDPDILVAAQARLVP